MNKLSFPGNETANGLWTDYELALMTISAHAFGLVEDFGVNVMPSVNIEYCSRMVNAHRKKG